MNTNQLSMSRCVSAIFACCLVAVLYSPLRADDKPAETVKTVEVKIEKKDVAHITLSVPETWEQQKPSGGLRLAQFGIPAAKGEENPAVLAVFFFRGSSIQANVDRWISQFDSKGRQSKVTQGQSPAGKYVFVDITGSFNQLVGPPRLRKTRKISDGRMLAVILIAKSKGLFFLKMSGDNKTVSSAAVAFRNSFGAKADKEKPLEGESKK